MPRGVRIDEDALWVLLLSRANRRGVVTIKQVDLAKEMGVTAEALNRCLARMMEAKRMKRISSRTKNVGVYALMVQG